MNKRGKSRSGMSLSTGEPVDRRTFLAAATGVAAAGLLPKAGEGVAAPAPASVTAPGTPLPLEGGAPVRSTLLEAKLSGPQYYDDEEKRELVDVLENRSPF